MIQRLSGPIRRLGKRSSRRSGRSAVPADPRCQRSDPPAPVNRAICGARGAIREPGDFGGGVLGLGGARLARGASVEVLGGGLA